ncbi:GNAT family N-acetyltransferase [Pedobacter nyackensis]|uniref:Ribosomal-protein-alanine N-acetyltransferase n=1 Tax=Pedobacter nyackensis TaxID=475255 RepID=A0A1W2ANT6_9SPHI|nr:GNAT family N-acetyltransferase [Pedobacter nyackensis]SMC62101.1 ribosomal-protein-alanine N-acetyltransferase [Pedobacter nyackensis]
MLNIILPKLPELETERLILREQRISDAPVLYDLRTNEQVMRYIDRPTPKNVEESQQVIQSINDNFNKGANLIWAITLKSNPELMIGNLGFWRTDLPNHRAEIGYMLQPDYWRKGILSEALSKVIDFGFNDVKLHSICANINPANEASRSLLLKHGFVKEAYFREDYYFEGKFLDSEIYGLLKA